MLHRTLLRRGGGDKSSFAAKRMVIHPPAANSTVPSSLIRSAYTTDAVKWSKDVKFASGGAMEKDVLDIPPRLEGVKSRMQLMAGGDKEFDALVEFVRGARHDDFIGSRRFQKAFDALSENDEVIVWLCMVAMAILNPGDVRSRLLYRHLEALVQAVSTREMTPQVAYRFYVNAIRSPAYRQVAAKQLETGASTRLAGLCAAADAMRKLNVSRRPMSPYFELYQRITERSEAMSPWGFPPIFQFEERYKLPERLRPFQRSQAAHTRPGDRVRRQRGPYSAWSKSKHLFIIPSWQQAKRWVGPRHTMYPGMIAD